ncbi:MULTISPECIES: Scr1 family TA system antitoxin-like transcriptional regulator [Amycolatopsis]|nr:Scr1 family TA system antitoxin-like transcriptional regulator [Amycolatopsis bullii]
MAEYREPNIRARQLGDRLLQRMAEKGWGVREMSRRLEMSAQWVSAVTRGRARPDPVNLARFLTVLGVRGAEYHELMALGDEMRKPGLLENPGNLRTLIAHEQQATAISSFHGVVIPGLLQTADYARALANEMGHPCDPDQVDEHVFTRLSRQAILTRPRARFSFYLHEFALRLPVGPTPAVMRAQLHNLAKVRDNAAIRVIPATGGHAGLAGDFQLVESDSFRPVIYLESEVSALYLEEPREISAYRRILRALAKTALDEAESRMLITRLARELPGVDMPEKWRKSTHSSQADCVEVALDRPVLIRDTKDREGGILTASTATWRELLTRLR